MRIIFEEHQYEATPEVLETLKDISALQDVEKKIAVNYVGYFYNSTIRDCVFILPKVLLKDLKDDDGNLIKDENGRKIEIIADIVPKDKIKDYVTPEDIITRKGQEKYLDEAYRKFIYEFSIWIYRALCIYRRNNSDSKAIYYKQVLQSGRGKRHIANTYLDIVLSLIRFNQENQNFFMFTIRNIHSGLNKINWTKTIAKSQAIIQNGTPIYLDPVNKKRKVNFDEELFIIFFSILNYLNGKYGFRTPINFQYELIGEKRFEQYLKGYGKTRLRQIKYKYFSDKALILWDLCYAFFDSAYELAVNTDQKEYLLAKNFNIVFEAMIDDLIGTPHDEIPKGLADQSDGKRVDHLYAYDSLVHTENKPENEIYYIGDSKYYKADNNLGTESIYKQYTYARNVIQWNINLFLDEDLSIDKEESDARVSDKKNKRFNSIRIRKDENDNVAEGYNVIPNFFISAFVYPDRKYVASENIRGHRYTDKNGDYVVDKDGKYRPQTYISYQFPNRLFDRDTLILSHYDVNFLYVLYLYARNKASEKTTWKELVRRKFKDEIRKVLEEKFEFYAMTPHDGEDVAKDFIQSHFASIIGKIYTPYADNTQYALALSKGTQGNKELKDEIGKYFYITDNPIKLGDDPTEELEKKKAEKKITHIKHKQGILVGLVKDKKHMEWIEAEHKYNIRNASAWYIKPRPGALVLTRDLYLVHEIVLYKQINDIPQLIGAFQMESEDSIPSIYKYADMENLMNPYPYSEGVEKEKREYIMYEIDTDSMIELTDADKERYKQLILDKGRDEKGRLGKPFVI